MNQVKKAAFALSVVSFAGVASAEVKQPLEVINRPLTSPAGQADAGAQLGFLFIKDADAFKLLGLGAGYGINDKLDLHLSYSTCLEDGCEFKGPLSLDLGYGLMQTGAFQLAANASIGYDTLAEGITPLELGARIRYNLNDKMAIVSPGSQLTITIDDMDTGVSPIYLSLPVGFGYQANSNLFVSASTNLATIEIKDAETQFIFDDNFGLDLQGIYAVNKSLDVGLSFGVDLFHADEAQTLGLMARGYF